MLQKNLNELLVNLILSFVGAERCWRVILSKYLLWLEFSRAAQEVPDRFPKRLNEGATKANTRDCGAPLLMANQAWARGNGPPRANVAEQESKQTRATPAWWGIGGHTPGLSALPAPAASELLPSRWICGLRICLTGARGIPGSFSPAPMLQRERTTWDQSWAGFWRGPISWLLSQKEKTKYQISTCICGI